MVMDCIFRLRFSYYSYSLLVIRKMSRYRPPAPKSSPYISRDGFERLQQELKDIWTRRADVTMHLSAAAAEGDRSENAEYIYRKKELRELDRRIRYLQKRLPDLTIVERRADDQHVYFGAWVELETDEGEIKKLRLVGADEIDPAAGYISIDSPVARALLKKTVDDDISVVVAGETINYMIVSVAYAAPSK